MIYQLGLPGFKKFQKTIEFLDAGDYGRAAAEALDSEWARQVPSRAKEITDMIKG
jgi:lysozyme